MQFQTLSQQLITYSNYIKKNINVPVPMVSHVYISQSSAKMGIPGQQWKTTLEVAITLHSTALNTILKLTVPSLSHYSISHLAQKT